MFSGQPTPQIITGDKKHSEERATLFGVRQDNLPQHHGSLAIHQRPDV